MKHFVFLFACWMWVSLLTAQTVPQKLAMAVQQLEAAPQLKYAIFSLYVVDTKTGKPVYAHNHNAGLAPASTQKLFTSVAAFELLGRDFRYKTSLGYTGTVGVGSLKGNLYLVGSGDPTLGSWRWKETRDTALLAKFIRAIRQAGITRSIDGMITTDESCFTRQAIPDGWIWQDIGNYYGAGAYALNWKENQYDLHLRSGGRVGDSVMILEEETSGRSFINELSAAASGSGDNAYIYLGTAGQRQRLVSGTIPVNERAFSISGASANPAGDLVHDLSLAVAGEGIAVSSSRGQTMNGYDQPKDLLQNINIFSTHFSPPLDSINFWFLRRSINLYGEALVKTLAYKQEGQGSTTRGVELLRDFWQQQGIDKAAIHILDGSGLSPQNRVTTGSLVQVLQYARTRPWYHSFYNCLPEYNGMKMKSGSIGGARSFAGYHKSRDGKEYTYAIIVNNYDGSSGEMVKQLYKVLDVLK